MSCAEVKSYNGEPSIFVDGELVSPMFMLMREYQNADYLKNLRKSGIRVFFVYAETDWLRQNGFKKFEAEVLRILESVPDAYIMVRLQMHPPKEWVEQNLDEVVRHSDGNTIPCRITWGSDGEDYVGHYSMASEKWQIDGGEALKDFCDKVDSSVISSHIIGYFFCAGGTCEWYYNVLINDYENNRVGDFSPAFKKAYSKFLRRKYKTVENLRKAWRIKDATFENPIIPPFEQRKFAERARLMVFGAEKIGTFPVNKEPEKDDYSFDVFLDSDKCQYVADFYDAWHEGAADSLIYFSKVIKEKYNNGKLTGGFFGACGCTDFFNSPTSGGTIRVLDSGVVDLLSSPGTYVNRYPGGCVAQRVMTDSIKLRNMIYMSEEDSRTHLADKLQTIWGKLHSERETIVTLKRDFARNICDGTYAWWFDMSRNFDKGWYMSPAIYKLFARQQEIAKLSYKNHKNKSNEIAAIYSLNSFHHVSGYVSDLMVDYYRNSELHHIGAGLDFYFNRDIEDMPDYKVYLMINLFNLSDNERDAIRKKATKNGAMIIWLYAPGFINPDEEKRVSLKNIEELIGMKVGCEEGYCAPVFQVEYPLSDAVKLADIDREYGHIYKPYVSSYSFYNEVGPHIESSRFYIDDDSVTVLGRYTSDGKTALAMKKDSYGITNVYCASRILNAELLTSLAEYAGCHIYNHKEDCILVNNNFLTVHAAYTGKHTIYLKENCNPFEVYEKKYYGKNIDVLEVDMKKGDTLMFSLNDKLSEELR